MSHTPDHLTILETTLVTLAPAASGLNRDRVMFAAGQQSAPRRLLWPILAGLFACLSASLGWQLLTRPEPQTQIVERLVTVPMPVPTSESPAAAMVSRPTVNHGQAFHTSAGYLSRRDQIVSFGTDVLPASPLVVDSPPEPAENLKSLRGSI